MSLDDFTLNRTLETIFQYENTASVIDENELIKALKCLRAACTQGPHVQNSLANNVELNNFIYNILFTQKFSDLINLFKIQEIALQLLVNILAQNNQTKEIIWQRYGSALLCACSASTLNSNTDLQLMVLYNIFHDSNIFSKEQALQIVVQVWQKVLTEKCTLNLSMLHFFFEYFLVSGGFETIRCYNKLHVTEQTIFLDYVTNYIQQHNPNGHIHKKLLEYIAKEFKIRSDTMLRATQTIQQEEQTRKTYALLKVIASASGSEVYAKIFETDHALFLNVSSLLRCLDKIGKESSNSIFAPMQKLEEVALNSKISHDFEAEISFELKTLLVRCVANLLFKNTKNQEYCLDTNLMPVLFECTNMDARNPLIKEWSILAIRNACDNCPQAQSVIANLTQQGPAPNTTLDELNLQMGSLRIKPDVK